MGKKKVKTNRKMQAWIDARKRHHLSHAHVQMARELGMNPQKLGKLDNHRQEPWKLPLPAFIEELYLSASARGARPPFSPAKSAGRSSSRRKRRSAMRRGSAARGKHERVPVLRVPGRGPAAHG